MDFFHYVSIANILAVIALIFASGRLVERLQQLDNRMDDCEEKVSECEHNKLDNAVLASKVEGFKVALENSNRLLEKALYDKRDH